MRQNIGVALLFQFGLLPSIVMAASAVAVDKTSHKYGYCHAKAAAEEAKQCAIASCKQHGGNNCVVVESGSKGGNSAIAAGSGQVGTFLDSFESEEMVSARAMWDCQMKASGCGYDEVQTGQCQVPTSCKIVAKWSDPEGPRQPSSGRTNQRDPSNNGAQYPANTQSNLGFLTQANAMMRDKRFDEAIALYTQFIDANPNSPGAYNNRGSAYSKKFPPDYQAAYSDFDQAIRLRPSGMYYYNRALMSNKLGNQQGYLDDMQQSAKMGFALAKTKLASMNNRQGPAPGTPAPAPSNVQPPPAAAAPSQPGGYQTCSLPSDRIANRGGAERATDPAYANVCMAILPPTCRNWTMNRQPCAVRACVVSSNLNRCPGGEPPSYVAKEVLPFTQAELAAMNAQIDAEAKRIAAQRGNGGSTSAGQYWQTQIMHRQTEWANGGAGGVTYNGQ